MWNWEKHILLPEHHINPYVIVSYVFFIRTMNSYIEFAAFQLSMQLYTQLIW